MKESGEFQTTLIWISQTQRSLEMSRGVKPVQNSGLLGDSSTILLVLGFALGIVTVGVMIGFVQYYYCRRRRLCESSDVVQSLEIYGETFFTRRL